MLGAVKVKKGSFWGWASLFMGFSWATWIGLIYRGVLDMFENFWRRSVSLCGSSVKGTWREGPLAGDPDGYVEKALETGISFHRGPVWGTWRGAYLPGKLRDG